MIYLLMGMLMDQMVVSIASEKSVHNIVDYPDTCIPLGNGTKQLAVFLDDKANILTDHYCYAIFVRIQRVNDIRVFHYCRR